MCRLGGRRGGSWPLGSNETTLHPLCPAGCSVRCRRCCSFTACGQKTRSRFWFRVISAVFGFQLCDGEYRTCVFDRRAGTFSGSARFSASCTSRGPVCGRCIGRRRPSRGCRFGRRRGSLALISLQRPNRFIIGFPVTGGLRNILKFDIALITRCVIFFVLCFCENEITWSVIYGMP